jgi:hypothetical protein
MVSYIYNPSTGEMEAGDQPGLHSETVSYKQKQITMTKTMHTHTHREVVIS